MPAFHLLWMRLRARIKVTVAVPVLLSLALSSCTASPDPNRTEGVAPQRVVSLVPTVTETLFALGAGDRVVGVSDFDNYPLEAMERPRVGALINPNVEKVFQLQPDLVITFGTQSLLQERLQAAGIRQYAFTSGSIQHVLDSIRALGREMDLTEEGDRLSDEITAGLDAIRKSSDDNRPRVLLAHNREIGTMGSFYTGGSRSYFDELIDIAGGRNIFSDVDENIFQPSLEEVFKRAPEVIIELLPSDPDGRFRLDERLMDWQVLAAVPAVRDGRVYVLSGDHLLLVGPRLHLAAAEIAEAIQGRSLTSN
jgi:iron complex transport system substrate-binding protein